MATQSTAENTYQSPVHYDEQRIRAAAVYCSDGRVGEHFDDFLQNGLGLPRYDRVALPGGPARLAGYDDDTIATRGVMDELKFLVEAHGLTRVILIQHQGCAFYRMRLDVDGESLRPLQESDLARAVEAVRDYTGLQKIDCYFAKLNDEGISFVPVPIE